MGTFDCAKSGALFSALLCGDCPHLEMDGIHHCNRLLIDLSVRVGGLSRGETAVALGLEDYQVREAEETGMQKVARRRLMLLEAA